MNIPDQIFPDGSYKLPKSTGGSFKLKEDRCLDPGHNIPMHIHIPSGHGYKHTCPRCGKVSIAKNDITFSAGNY